MYLNQVEAERMAARNDFIWHQRFDLGEGVFSPGVSNMPWLWEKAGVSDDLTGKTVLDIGTTNGATAFMAERRGAKRVVAVDVYDQDRFGFGALKKALGSQAEFVCASIYELPQVLEEQFDVVFFWGVLYHLRHPILALDNLRSVSRDLVYIETAVADHEMGEQASMSVARYYRLNELGNDGSNWFAPTTPCLVDWCHSSGLTPIEVASWPEGSPTRAHVVARVVDGPAEYLACSYELPLRATIQHEG